MNRRTLGIGVINFANYLAKNGVRYSDGSANGLTHRTFEAIQYYLLKASQSSRVSKALALHLTKQLMRKVFCRLILIRKIWMLSAMNLCTLIGNLYAKIFRRMVCATQL